MFSFPFLLPSYFHSVIYRVVSIVSDGCYQFSFVFFYEVFESLYRCVNAVFDADKSFSSLIVFHWSLNDSKSFQVSRILLSILVDLSNAVVWIVSTCPLISKFSYPLTNPLEIVLNAPITIGVTVTFIIIIIIIIIILLFWDFFTRPRYQISSSF